MKSKQRAMTQLKIRFIKRLKITDGCWEFHGGHRTSHGYRFLTLAGSFTKSGKSKNILVHRFSYRLFIGKISKGMFICHKCDNPICCNPEHLFQGSHADNMADMARKKRSGITWGERSGMHKLSTKDVEAIRASNARQIDLAEKYRVTKSTISEIINYKSRCYE